MTFEPKPSCEDEGVHAKIRSRHTRRGRVTPVARFHVSVLHRLDPIQGWLPVEGTLDMMPQSRPLWT